MAAEPFGPVELFALSFPQSRLPQGFRDSVAEVLESGVVTLLDLAVLRRSADGGLEVIELESVGDELELTSVELPAQGLIGEEDLETLAGELDASGTTVVLAVEHSWARRVAASVLQAGATVVANERIPAAAVNEVAALAEDDAESAQPGSHQTRTERTN
jgi:hypothetical protein